MSKCHIVGNLMSRLICFKQVDDTIISILLSKMIIKFVCWAEHATIGTLNNPFPGSCLNSISYSYILAVFSLPI